jgi:hypothetical protein
VHNNALLIHAKLTQTVKRCDLQGVKKQNPNISWSNLLIILNESFRLTRPVAPLRLIPFELQSQSPGAGRWGGNFPVIYPVELDSMI